MNECFIVWRKDLKSTRRKQTRAGQRVKRTRVVLSEGTVSTMAEVQPVRSTVGGWQSLYNRVRKCFERSKLGLVFLTSEEIKKIKQYAHTCLVAPLKRFFHSLWLDVGVAATAAR